MKRKRLFPLLLFPLLLAGCSEPDSYDILNAPVAQKYYVDPDNDTVSYICTDLTDLQGRSSLALDIAYGDLSEAEASRILEEDQTRHIEILEILETGDSVEVTVP